MNGYKVVCEALGEYPKIDEEMGKFFPSWWNKIKSGLEMVAPSKAARVLKEEKLVKSKFKNVDVEIRLNSAYQQNAWTIPGTRDIRDLANTWDYYGVFAKKSLPSLLTMNLKACKAGPNKTVIFPKTKCKFLIFTTKGLLTTMEPEERLAIYLHEIGHWAYTAQMMPRQLKHIKAERSRTNMMMFLYALGTFLRRFNEYESDLFAARVGYGDELKAAFDQFGRKRAGKISWLIKLSDWLMRSLLKQQEAEEEEEPGGAYPSMKQRKAQIDIAKKDKKYLKDES